MMPAMNRRQAALGRADLLGERAIAIERGRIERLVGEAVEEARHAPAAFSREVFLERGAGEVAVFAVAHGAARRADDLQVGREEAIGIEREEARQQHPLGKVAGGSEQQQTVNGEAHAQRPLLSCALTRRAGNYSPVGAYLFNRPTVRHPREGGGPSERIPQDRGQMDPRLRGDGEGGLSRLPREHPEARDDRVARRR